MTDEPLPGLVTISKSFSNRLPSQRQLDQLARLEPGMDFGELARTQPFRLMAFRALMRDYPDRDPTSLWLHAYDVEVDVLDVDPTNGKSPTASPLSATTGDFTPTSSTT
jgi:hypothetical protein